MKHNGKITVSYFGVNQAYQLALAAQELGRLDAFYCSLYDAPGKWGGMIASLLGANRVLSRSCAGFDPTGAIEIPGPLIRERLTGRFSGTTGLNRWFETACAFDRRVARLLKGSASELFVGVETCAEYSLAQARSAGMKTVLDCHGIGADFLDANARRAAEDLGLAAPQASDSPQMSARKARELALADHIFACSELQRDILKKQGVSETKISVVPLWVDPALWFPPPRPKQQKGPVKVVFGGKISLQKGVPYLARTLNELGSRIEILLVGQVQPAIAPLLEQFGSGLRCLPPRTKPGLREIFWEQDVLVLPSLGDSFGFVALEAMACGLPVIVTENCGVPVPEAAWRVPAMSSEAIAQRLKHYANDRPALERDGLVAREFARQFSPERYRKEIKRIFERSLSEKASSAPKVTFDSKIADTESGPSAASGLLAAVRRRK